MASTACYERGSVHIKASAVAASSQIALVSSHLDQETRVAIDGDELIVQLGLEVEIDERSHEQDVVEQLQQSVDIGQLVEHDVGW